MHKPLFSIVTPTYNRAHLLSRVFNSLKAQSLKNFEWVIIDDGSTDNTSTIIELFRAEADFEIKYFKTINMGKVHALNFSIDHCEGFFYLVFDSDDWCDFNALEIYYNEWQKLEDKDNYFALSALKRNQENSLVGNDYSHIDKYNCNYIDRVNLNIKGDKWDCFIFEKIKDFRFPIHKNDKYMAPSYLLYKLSEKYNVVFINKVISTIEYLPDGISANNIKHRVASALTTYKYYNEMLKIKGFSAKVNFRHKINKYRFMLHSKQTWELGSIFHFTFYLGLVLFIKDKLRLRFK